MEILPFGFAGSMVLEGGTATVAVAENAAPNINRGFENLKDLQRKNGPISC